MAKRGEKKTSRRMVITGLPCPPETWERFLGKRPNQRILPILEVLEHTASPDPRVISRYVSEQIAHDRPTSIVAHDLGVPLTLLALMRVQRRDPSYRPRVTFFNGAVRRVSLFKAGHMLRVQLMTEKRAIREVRSRGGTVDLRLRPYLPRIRQIYRLLLLFRVTEGISHTFGLDELLGIDWGHRFLSPLQIIGSPNDPYLPFAAIQQLASDFSAVRLVEVPYGHFPYSVAPERILPLVEEFERDVQTFDTPLRAGRPANA